MARETVIFETPSALAMSARVVGISSNPLFLWERVRVRALRFLSLVKKKTTLRAARPSPIGRRSLVSAFQCARDRRFGQRRHNLISLLIRMQTIVTQLIS